MSGQINGEREEGATGDRPPLLGKSARITLYSVGFAALAGWSIYHNGVGQSRDDDPGQQEIQQVVATPAHAASAPTPPTPPTPQTGQAGQSAPPMPQTDQGMFDRMRESVASKPPRSVAQTPPPFKDARQQAYAPPSAAPGVAPAAYGMRPGMPGMPGAPGAQQTDTTTHIAFQGRAIPGTAAGPAIDMSLVMMPGLYVCTLLHAIDTTTGDGPLLCTLRDAVKSPRNVTLMEPGTLVSGTYSGGIHMGQNRIPSFVASAITPNGVPVVLAGAASDALGRSGLPGDVNNHWGARLGGAGLLMLGQGAVNAATALAQRGNGNSYFNLNTGALNGAVSEILSHTMNIPTTISVDQGQDVVLFITQPVDFSPAYRLRAQ